MRSAIAVMLLILTAGCLDLFGGDEEAFSGPLNEQAFVIPDDLSGPLPADAIQWPDFSGQTLTVLHHGAFAAFGTAAARFENLTGARVLEVAADDTGSALNLAAQDAGSPQFDVLYGIDNILWQKALSADLFEPYTPQLAARVQPQFVFMDEPWAATPVDHGYIALNVDRKDPLLDRTSENGCASKNGRTDGNFTRVHSLNDVRALSCLFVTQDPNTSTPGLGFMLITIDEHGDTDSRYFYNWIDYWTDLLRGPDGKRCTGDEVLVTAGWSDAYENHFTGGYGNADWNDAYVGGRAIVTSYTESPAYEAYYGATRIADALYTAGAFHQIQTMGILRGTPTPAIAQAWVEFTLTDDFQDLAASDNAVYPVAPGIDVAKVYGGLDPTPGTFPTVGLDWRTIGANLDRWLDEWNDLYEEHACTALG